jgi:peptide/nickel transport system substrate-binding protein
VTSRDDADTFDYFYTTRGLSDPLWQAYKPSRAFDALSKTLAQRKFRTVDERRTLFARALELAMQDSVRIWLYERVSRWPRRADVQLVSDISGGVSGSLLWPYTLRVADRPGGTVKIAVPSMLTDPWNPIGGSDWLFDTTLYNATQDHATLYDPFTGLGMPQRFQRADVFVQQGLPVTKSSDWVTLSFVPAIRVPPDAIISWDAKAQRFITVGEKYPRGLSAKTKAVAYFPKDLFEKSQWHDGSRLSLGDMMLSLIVAFDRAKAASRIFDPSVVPAFESFEETFRGLRITSTDPLTVESYSDAWLLDAEEIAHGAADALWPSCGSGPCPWHTLAVGIRVESAGAAAFTAAKAAQRKVERMNYIAGPTLALLDRQMEAARVENYIPYRPALSRYITSEDARERWTSLARWRQSRGHYWIGLGPFLLQRVAPVEKIVELRRFDRFPDPAARWIGFDEPRIAAVAGSGPAAVKIGGAARFDVRITFKGRPYPPKDIAEVKFLTFNAKGALVATGTAAPDGGVWKIVLTPQLTRTLLPGSNRVEVIVVSKVVNKPSFSAITFTTLP